MFIASLIAADGLQRGDISAAADALGTADWQWVEEGVAAAFRVADPAAGLAAERLGLAADLLVLPEPARAPGLLVADMDSTMIAVECIDELADYAGVKAEVAAVTEQAMQGALDFEAALDARVALLAGLDAAAIDRCRAERVRLTPGARALVATLKARGAYTLLVSGGFTRFADPVAAEIGFDEARANRLEISGGRLTGRVERPIVGAQAKAAALRETAARRAVPLARTLAIGDGANDIPMLEAAGCGIAYRAKPAAAAAAQARIVHGDLGVLLYALGIARRDWAEG
jgi:phosphoserine phosphatase